MKTVNIKGKEYVEVNERVKYFIANYDDWSIETELLSNENGVCVFKAIVKDETGTIKATGHAYEREDSTYINKTSYIENCETSAVGRALGFLGIGIDTSIASSDEVVNAINNQEPKADSNKLDFDEYRERISELDVDGLRREYVNVSMNKNYSDKQKEALKKILTKAQEALK